MPFSYWSPLPNPNHSDQCFGAIFVPKYRCETAPESNRIPLSEPTGLAMNAGAGLVVAADDVKLSRSPSAVEHDTTA